MTRFSELALSEPLQRAVIEEGYSEPTPIQAQAIPKLLEGRDLLGCARTGTGKTAAFALPLLQRLSTSGKHAGPRSTRVLVVVPTRELAGQVEASFVTYGRYLKLGSATIYGGVGQASQVRALARGVDILVATPGRLLDLIGQGHVRLDKVETLVLDEADQMLDLGFLPDVRRILERVPRNRQTLLFSATMPPAISALAESILRNPAKVYVTPPATTVELVRQSVHMVQASRKQDLLSELLRKPDVERALVFTRTKHGADRVARRLVRDGIQAEAIHGNTSQNARERTLLGFRGKRVRVLVATDIAARGIDVDGVTHVFNYELPNVPESYVHRIGRTARAGAAGVAVSLCDDSEREYLRDIEKLMRLSVEVVGDSGSRLSRKPSDPPREGRGRPARPTRAAGAHAPRNARRPSPAGSPRTGGRLPAGHEPASEFGSGIDGGAAARAHAPDTLESAVTRQGERTFPGSVARGRSERAAARAAAAGQPAREPRTERAPRSERPHPERAARPAHARPGSGAHNGRPAAARGPDEQRRGGRSSGEPSAHIRGGVGGGRPAPEGARGGRRRRPGRDQRVASSR